MKRSAAWLALAVCFAGGPAPAQDELSVRGRLDALGAAQSVLADAAAVSGPRRPLRPPVGAGHLARGSPEGARARRVFAVVLRRLTRTSSMLLALLLCALPDATSTPSALELLQDSDRARGGLAEGVT